MTSVGTHMLVEPGAGVSIELGLGRPTIKVGGALRGQVGVVEGVLPPGGGNQVPHWHEELDEVFYVLKGEIEFLLDGSRQQASAGTTSFVPAGMVHTFRNASDRPAPQLVLGPVKVAELIAELGENPRERWGEVQERHRSHCADQHG
jgi:uncharacterized cupin superfamily protein